MRLGQVFRSYNVCLIKIRSKHISNTLLSLLRFFMRQMLKVHNRSAKIWGCHDTLGNPGTPDTPGSDWPAPPTYTLSSLLHSFRRSCRWSEISQSPLLFHRCRTYCSCAQYTLSVFFDLIMNMKEIVVFLWFFVLCCLYVNMLFNLLLSISF